MEEKVELSQLGRNASGIGIGAGIVAIEDITVSLGQSG
jgi:hypothetical protein